MGTQSSSVYAKSLCAGVLQRNHIVLGLLRSDQASPSAQGHVDDENYPARSGEYLAREGFQRTEYVYKALHDATCASDHPRNVSRLGFVMRLPFLETPVSRAGERGRLWQGIRQER